MNGVNGHTDTETMGKGRTGPPGPPAPPVPGAMLRSSGDHDDSRILAAVDRLRELGIGRTHNLPQIIVCGAQSAGKSSVLESIVQVPFPRGMGTVTRYVTKVTMERAAPGAAASVDVRIIPGQGRAAEHPVCHFHRRDDSPGCAGSLARFMQEAHALIFPPGNGANDPLIADDVLVVTVHGPDARPLQVLDLPGLISWDTQRQGNDTAIEELVTRYMAEPHSIILAVITATEDLQNQKVLDLCDKHDEAGARTIRVVTRPDVAEEHRRRHLVGVMLSRDANPHRWHVLRNRTPDEANSSQTARDLAEARLLSGAPWSDLDPSSRGIAELVKHLRGMLFDVAKRELPVLCDRLRANRRALDARFAALGGRRPNPDDLAAAMKSALDRLRVASHDHARGIYESDVTALDDDGPVNLRSRVLERADVFHDIMVARGHAWTTHIVHAPPGPNADMGSVFTEALPAAPAAAHVFATREEGIAWVAKKLKATRDDLLPTFLNPHRIGNLFWELSAPWDRISRTHIEQVHTCCAEYFSTITPLMFAKSTTTSASSGFGSSARDVARRFVRLHVAPRLDECRKQALEELGRLEEDRKAAPVVSDLRFLWNRRRHLEEKAFEREAKAGRALGGGGNGVLDKTAYAKAAGLHTQDEWTFATADEFYDAMWSLYEVSWGSVLGLGDGVVADPLDLFARSNSTSTSPTCGDRRSSGTSCARSGRSSLRRSTPSRLRG